MRTRWALVASLAALALSGCSKGDNWVLGQWVLLAEDGKPGACHEFKKDGKFITYTTSDCGGSADALLSGQWELKDPMKLALKRGNDLRGKLAVVTEKTAERFVSRGAVTGALYRVGAGGAAEVLRKLDEQGLIKLKPLPPELGCRQLGLGLPEIRKLPTEKEPRMLRQKDQSLEYHANTATGDPKVEKVVYAMQQETIEWIALHLTAEAFAPPGPEERVQSAIGKPADAVATGTGEKRQHIAMWKSYCAQLRDTPNKDIDVTLFSTTGERRGTLYVSENVVSNLWEDMKQMVKDPAAQSTDEDEEETQETPAKADTKAATPKAEAKKATPKAEAKKATPKAEAKKATPKPADDDDI